MAGHNFTINDIFEDNVYDVYLNLKPVRTVINTLYTLSKRDDVNLFVISTAPTLEVINEQIVWLTKYVPFISKANWYFVGGNHNHVDYLNKICYNIDVSDVYLVCSNYSTLEIAEDKGYNALHVSTFLSEDI